VLKAEHRNKKYKQLSRDKKGDREECLRERVKVLLQHVRMSKQTGPKHGTTWILI
jgi:hypothetical protein